jgi:uncharacterized repeat protein (TIGR01451 family)
LPTPATNRTRRLVQPGRRVGLGWLAACAGLLVSLSAHAAPAPGTAIDNAANAAFADASQTVTSNTVTVVVAAAGGVDLVADRSATAFPGATVALSHTLTNLGTGDDAYTIVFQDLGGDDYDFASLLLLIDANANGAPDPGETFLASGDTLWLAAGASQELLLLVAIPAGAVPGGIGRVQIVATSGDPAVSAANVDIVTVAAWPAPEIAFFRDPSFGAVQTESPLGAPLFVEGRAASCDADPLAVETARIRLRSALTDDDEIFTAVETGPSTGVFQILPGVPTADASALAGNGVVETRAGDTVTASIEDCATSALAVTQIAITAEEPTAALFVAKEASRDFVEIGEWIEYELTVRNAGSEPLGEVVVEDRLPGGFRYERGSARRDAARIDDPEGGAGPVLRFAIGALAPGVETMLRYRVLVGPGSARNGDAVNRAQARSGSLQSNVARARVRLVDGVFSDRGFIVGKVFADCNGDRQQDRGEPGIPNVALFLEDGTSVRTDAAGKYSFYGVSPRTHALKVDGSSLPEGARLSVLHHRFAFDPGSQFVDMKRGELYRADFAIEGCDESVLAIVRERERAARAEAGELAEVLERELERDDPREVERDVRALPASGSVSRGRSPLFDGARRPDGGLDARNSNRPPLPVQPAPSVPLEQEVPTLDPSPGFLDLADGAVMTSDLVNLRVKGRVGTQLELRVNGETVPLSRVGQRSAAPASGAQAWEYVGVRLLTGRNLLELREVDGFGNVRGEQRLEVVAPGQLARLRIELPETQLEADGATATPLTIFVEDRDGNPVTARTPLTLGTSSGLLRGADLDPVEPGLQVFAEQGRAQVSLVAPSEPGEARIRAVSGLLEAENTIRFLPHMRPLIGIGVVDAVLGWSQVVRRDRVPSQEHDAFEEEIRELLIGDEDREASAGVRGALFVKGRVKGDALLTLRVDSEEDRYGRLFRDIEPDRFYPVYGDSSTRLFDAQSTGRFYGRLDRGASYAMYGDFVTEDHDDAVGLGAYRRGLTGGRAHFERSWIAIDAFASHDDSLQVVEEIRGRGIAGPYDLRRGDVLENSELVEILVRDRDQPSLVLEMRSLSRFVDYEIDWLAGTLLLREPLPSFDSNLNPVSVRVTYEVESNGDEFWVTGISAKVEPLEGLRIGAGYVEDRNPAEPLDLLSGHVAYDLDDRTRAVAEVAHSDDGGEKGLAGRVDIRHQGERLDAWAYWVKSESEFANPNSLYLRGRTEVGLRSSYRWRDRTRLVGNAIWTEDEELGGERRGAEAYVEQALGRWLTGELGLRYVDETSAPASLDTAFDGITPNEYLSVRAKLSAPLPWWPRLSLFGEYEQDVSDFGARMLAGGGELQVWNRTRLYARHEFLSSLGSLYTLNGEQERNVTLFGIESDLVRNTSAFSEYRVSDVIGGRDAEAAIGLRNRWTIAQGLTLHTAAERVQSVAGDAIDDDDATSVSLGLAWTRSALWKATGRVEYRHGETQNAFLSTFGVAARIDESWSVLGRNLLYLNGIQQDRAGGDDVVQRFQVGVAYRPTETNRWNALGRYEIKYEDESDRDFDSRRLVHVVSTHLDYQLAPKLRSNGRWAVKWAQALADGPNDDALGQLVSGRVTYDIGKRWDVGLIGSAHATGFDAVDYGLGAEVGYLLGKNLWLAVGYNLLGFEDDDLVDGDYSDPGVYLRLRVKFDEELLRWLQP